MTSHTLLPEDAAIARPSDKRTRWPLCRLQTLVLTLLLIAASCASDSSKRVESQRRPIAPIAPRDISDFFNCLRRASAVLVAARRGGPAPGFPENAISTFEHTISLAPALIETDVSMTSDGVLMLMEDERPERITDGHGRLRDSTWRGSVSGAVLGRVSCSILNGLASMKL